METSRELNVLLDHKDEESIPAKKIIQYDRAILILLQTSPLALMRPNLPYDKGFVVGVDSLVKPRKLSVNKSTPHLPGEDTGFVRGLRPLLQFRHANPSVIVDSFGLPLTPASQFPMSSGVQQKSAREIVEPKTMKSINSELCGHGASANRLPPRLQDLKAGQAHQPPSGMDTSAMDVVGAVSPNQPKKDKKIVVLRPTNDHIIAEYKRAKNLSLMTGQHSEQTKEQSLDGNAVVGNTDVDIQTSSKLQTTSKDLEAAVQVIINMLRPANVDTLAKEIRELPISNIIHLERVVDMIFVKAVEEPALSQACARMCKILSGMPVLAGTAEGQELVNVRAFLVNRCQTEFAKHKALNLSRNLILEEVGQVQDGKQRSDYLAVYLTLERKVQSTFFRSIRFYGVLFNAQLLSTSLMHLYIAHLLSLGHRESLECLCSLLTTIGKTLESKSGLLGNANDLTEYFDRLTVLMQECKDVSPALHRVLQDVIILRNRNWVPRNDPPISNTMVPSPDPTKKTSTNAVELKPETLLGTFSVAETDSAKAIKSGEKETARGYYSNDLLLHTMNTGAAEINSLPSSILPSLAASVKSTPTPEQMLASTSRGAIPKMLPTAGVGSVVPQQLDKEKILMLYGTGSTSGGATPKIVPTGGVGSVVPQMAYGTASGGATLKMLPTAGVGSVVPQQTAKEKILMAYGTGSTSGGVTPKMLPTAGVGSMVPPQLDKEKILKLYATGSTIGGATPKMVPTGGVGSVVSQQTANYKILTTGSTSGGIATNGNALFDTLRTFPKGVVTDRRVNVASDTKHSKRPKMSSEFSLEHLQILLAELLPKFTTDDISVLLSEVQTLPIDSNQKMKQAFNVIFDMGVGEVKSMAREALAEALRALSQFPLPAQSEHAQTIFDFRLQLRILVVNRCNESLERNTKLELERDNNLNNMNVQSDVEEKSRLYTQCLEEERGIRLKFVQFVEFCLVLFQRQLLSAKMLHRCIRHLFSSGDDVSLTCLCQLMLNVGKELDDAATTGTVLANQMTEYFNRLKEIASDPKWRDAALPLHTMILDLLRLRDKKWLVVR